MQGEIGDEEAERPPGRRGKWRYVLTGVAAIAILLSLINASWLAPRPPGRLIVVANRGIAVPFDHTGLKDDDCTATRIRPPGDNPYIENTLPSLYRALKTGADAVAVQVHPTKDGDMVVFHDWTLDCRTNGHGPVRDLTLAQLKKLDVGYGYTADGGRTFPFRGKGVGAMPSVEELLRELPKAKIVFIFKSKDPRDADALVAAFRRAGIAIDDKYGFQGPPAVGARMRQLVPGAWFNDGVGARACLKAYVEIGWTGFMPASCRDTTIIVPLNYRWALWGWPYRFLDRMAKANTRVVIWGSYKNGGVAALDRPEQYDQVPADFHGWLWVDDFYTMGPALQR
ncbi:MAG: glycerophosphoryl diester phosphodiesterase [Sphingomonadales bacterium]|jgi:glycerophosphoryl diester phosphodiesterase|nr:glycerophosphoryl diester phosphodiesterase [Sphingomonadales bacterium]